MKNEREDLIRRYDFPVYTVRTLVKDPEQSSKDIIIQQKSGGYKKYLETAAGFTKEDG